MTTLNGNGHLTPSSLTHPTEWRDEPTTTFQEQTQTMREKLDAKIPRDVIETRDSGFGKPLSYLSGWYVIARMNEILGQGNWDYQLQDLTKTFEGEVNGKNYVSYLARVRLRAQFPNGECAYFEDIGFGDAQDKNNPGKAHELATKEAVTDGVKRCAKSLGMSLGLALYDKTQEFVENEQKTETQSDAKVLPPAGNKRTSAPSDTTAAGTVSAPQRDATRPSTGTREILTATIKALAAQGKLVIAEFKHTRKEKYGVELVKDLTDAQAKEELEALNKQYNLGGK